MVVSPIRSIVTLAMELEYQWMIHCYPNSQTRVTKACHPYGTNFCGLHGSIGAMVYGWCRSDFDVGGVGS